MRNLVQKPWGWTETVSDYPTFQMHRIDIRAGMACSWHHHVHKWNGFLCARGLLIIEYTEGVTSGAPEQFQTVILSPGESFDVRPMWTHRMRAHPTGAVMAHEYYWPDPGRKVTTLVTDDIIRVSESGVYVP